VRGMAIMFGYDCADPAPADFTAIR